MDKMSVHNPVNTTISFALLISIVGGSFFYVNATDPEEPWLGIAGMGVTPAMAQEIGLQEPRGLLIFIVEPGSPADVSGLRGGDTRAVVDGQEVLLGGDVIIAVDRVQIQGVEDTEALLAEKAIGDSVRFTVIRSNTTQDFNVVIGSR